MALYVDTALTELIQAPHDPRPLYVRRDEQEVLLLWELNQQALKREVGWA